MASRFELTKDEIRQNILSIAQSRIGYTEKPAGSNNTEFGEWYGLNGDKWCGIFVSYCYNFGGYGIGHIDRPEGFHYVPTMYHRSKQRGWRTDDPKPADIVLIDFNGDGKYDHTGIFVKWIDKSKGSFLCIEGNTSFDDRSSQSNGGAVADRLRTVTKTRAVFVNIIDKRIND